MTAFITSTAEVGICPRCQTPILAGYAEGLPARVDLTPVSASGEIASIREGRATYSLHRGKLEYRDDFRIAAGRRNDPVLIAHQCGVPLCAEYRDTTQAPVQILAPVMGGIPY